MKRRLSSEAERDSQCGRPELNHSSVALPQNEERLFRLAHPAERLQCPVCVEWRELTDIDGIRKHSLEEQRLLLYSG